MTPSEKLKEGKIFKNSNGDRIEIIIFHPDIPDVNGACGIASFVDIEGPVWAIDKDGNKINSKERVK